MEGVKAACGGGKGCMWRGYGLHVEGVRAACGGGTGCMWRGYRLHVEVFFWRGYQLFGRNFGSDLKQSPSSQVVTGSLRHLAARALF